MFRRSLLVVVLLSPPALAQRVSSSSAPSAELEPVVVLGTRIETNPAGRSIGRVDRRAIESKNAFTLADVLDEAPGVTTKPSNGPRDMNVSLRGSGAKTSFGVRNIKMYEDWFPLTQSDGLSRTDLHDPTAYEGVDVLRGPSSALYDDYALGGVLNFRTRPGGDVDGWDLGAAGGSYGYQNEHVHLGRKTKGFEYSVFASHIRGDGYTDWNGFKTVTENILMRFYPDEDRTITFKFLNNDLEAQVPSRLSRAQLDLDPRSAGTTAATGLGTVTAQQADQSRHDRRTITGLSYEQRLDPETSWRFLGEYDVKDIYQVFGTIGDNTNPEFQQTADVTREGTVLDRPSRFYAGEFFNRMDQRADGYFNLGDGAGTQGGLQADTRGYHQNAGARLREEVDVADRWTAIAGVGAEQSRVKADVQSTTSTATTSFSRVSVDRLFYNAAPEADLVYSADGGWKGRARAAMGYGVPAISQLTTAPNGLAGNNTGLKPQRNLGFELGAGRMDGALRWDAAAYYETFWNEFVTQSPGAGLASFTANAPRADHRGVELWGEWRGAAGAFLSGAFDFNDHVYRTFRESIGGGVSVDRAGSRVPGVERTVANLRAGWDGAGRPGGWVEVNRVGSYAVDDSNVLRTKDYVVVNLNAHWKRDVRWGPVKRVTVTLDVSNALNAAYDGSAVVVSDSFSDTPAAQQAKQAFFAGQGRSVYGGATFHF